MTFEAIVIQAKLTINPGSSIAPSSQPDGIVKIDDCGDVLIWGLWPNRMDGIIYVLITDTDKPSAGMRDPEKVLQSQEKEKEKKHLAAYI